MKKKSIIAAVALSLGLALFADNKNNVIEEVAWMIGDEPIYKSEIEKAYQEMLSDRTPIQGDPYCIIPEQIAVERLFLHQADIDTVEVQESLVQMQLESQMNYLINNLGSREKVEQYFGKPMTEIREYYATNMRNRSRVQQVRNDLTKNLKVTPSDVRESEFSTLAILYSEDGSSVRGGELGFMGRGQLVPEYAAVAFNLNDPKKVSKIVETEYGFHIIQLIEKRGDRINTRHILLRPKVADKDLTDAIHRLDSLRTDIVDNKKVSFEEAVRYVSQDKDTRMSNGVMVNSNTGTTRFQMSELPQEVAKAVGTMEPGEISQPFIMRDPKRDREIVAMVRLTNRIDAHSANLAEDYQTIKDMYEAAESQAIIDKWLADKIKTTYVRIEDGWRDCDFQHKGWIKSTESK